MRSRLSTLMLLAATVAASAQVRPARVPAPMTGTATLSGVVVSDDADARPIRRAAVTLNAPGDPRRQWVTSTDDTGRFAFAGLPSGSFSLVAAKPGFVRTYFGARRPGSTVGVPIAVADGSAVANVTLKMARGAVITGTVFDERGRPMPGVSVRARRLVRAPDGTRTFGSIVPGISATSTTDDRGVYRIYGLSPDDYVVSAEPVLVRAGLAAGTDGIEVRAPTDAELQWAERQVQSAAPAPAAQAAAPAVSRPMAYAAVFYPNAVDPIGRNDPHHGRGPRTRGRRSGGAVRADGAHQWRRAGSQRPAGGEPDRHVDAARRRHQRNRAAGPRCRRSRRD